MSDQYRDEERDAEQREHEMREQAAEDNAMMDQFEHADACVAAFSGYPVAPIGPLVEGLAKLRADCRSIAEKAHVEATLFDGADMSTQSNKLLARAHEYDELVRRCDQLLAPFTKEPESDG